MAEMRAYWQTLCRGRAIPQRSDIEPRSIKIGLDHAFILERMAPGAARFRLAGRHLIDLMGMEVRGMPLCAVLNPTSRGRLSDILEAVFKAPQIAELELFAKAEYGRPEMRAQVLLLPLKSDLGDVTRALGCLVSEGRVGMAPRRFDLVGDKMLPIIEGGKTLAPSPSAGNSFISKRTSRGSTPVYSHATDVAKMPQMSSTDQVQDDSPEARRALFKLVSLPGEGNRNDRQH
ncbi:PAS domain-containing protein [Paracoccus fistulariae]|uniref:PAS domain-containing protein n=2 Tax=Paracoccus fistulariae TaxID=658446 RepID=A0ABY7SR34_9RHOB|nr:PAS domain-containing protein [Paracoccus fistulariae]